MRELHPNLFALRIILLSLLKRIRKLHTERSNFDLRETFSKVELDNVERTSKRLVIWMQITFISHESLRLTDLYLRSRLEGLLRTARGFVLETPVSNLSMNSMYSFGQIKVDVVNCLDLIDSLKT